MDGSGGWLSYILPGYGRDAIKGLILSLFIYSECRVLGQVEPFLVPGIKRIIEIHSTALFLRLYVD